MFIFRERVHASRRLFVAGLAFIAMACGSSSSTPPAATKCETDNNCKNSEFCSAGSCQAYAKCNSTADCLRGQECSSLGVCRPIGGGNAGAGGSAGTGASTSGGGTGACAANNGTCTVNGDCCGYPSASHCVNFGGSSATCAPLCTTASDCATGCCASLMSGAHACGPSTACVGTGGTTGGGGTGGCVGDLGTCATNGDCCGYPNSNRCVDLGLGPLCAIVCTSGAQCASGCCTQLQSGYMVCAPATNCP